MTDLLNKIVSVKFHHDKERINRDHLLKGGRVLKIHQDGAQVLVLNPECESLDDMVGNDSNRIRSTFKWASWVHLDEADFEIIEKFNE